MNTGTSFKKSGGSIFNLVFVLNDLFFFQKKTPIFLDGLSTDDEGQIRQSIDLDKNLCTSSPIKSADIHK